MRNFKVGLVVLGAVGVIALMGSSSASATVLCKANESPTCVGPKTWPSGSSFELKKNSLAQFSLGKTTVGCAKATAQLTIGSGTPLPVTITNVKFIECSNMCTVTARNLPWLGKIKTVTGSPGAGTLTLEPREGANPSVNITCQGVSCIYGSANAELFTAGGAAGAAKLNVEFGTSLALEEPNKLCEAEATWIGDYIIVATDGIYVV
jgi:hypothetical protein